MTRVRVELDRDLCIGAGNCVRLAPAAFALDDEDIAIVLDPGSESIDVLRRAADVCPSMAITVVEEPER